jgi:hypothetical protein
MNQLIQKYSEMIKNDLDINDINIGSVAKALPTKRHFWTARLIDHKITSQNLKRKKDSIVKAVAEQLGRDSPIALRGPSTIKAATENNDTIKDINYQITDNDIVIEFLEAVQKNFFAASYDIKNVIELLKLETQ